MPRIRSALLAVALASAAAVAAPDKWAKDIDAFAEGDARHPPPQHGVVFVGSSSIVKWRSLEHDFPGLPVINRGFGGSDLTDTTYYADRIIVPYHPAVVVIYAGENDLGAGKKADVLLADFRVLTTKLETELPSTRIVFISIKPSPVRAKVFGEIARANTLIAGACAHDPRLTFVDIQPLMARPDGSPRDELYQPDHLHLNAAGYALWVPPVARAIRAALR